jgi:hypothetical protein
MAVNTVIPSEVEESRCVTLRSFRGIPPLRGAALGMIGLIYPAAYPPWM